MKKIYILLFALCLIKIANAQWTTLTSGTTQQLNSVYFTSNDTGYVVGNSGTILKTINGGNTWTSQTSGTTNFLNSVFFTDANIGYAVGNSGIIIKTTNAGNTWSTKTSGTTLQLNAVYFANTDTGYAVGNNYAIVKTYDGGATWVNISGTGFNLSSVFFTNSTTGYIASSDGYLRKTTNGGLSWTNETSNGLYSIYFTDVNTGYTVGGYGVGTILKTSNAGVTWTTYSTFITQSKLYSVFFTDINNGYAVGNQGAIIKTNNAGVSWSVITSGTTNNLSSVFFPNTNTGYAVGSSGTILKYSNIPLSVKASATPTTICNGASTQLTATLTSGTTPYTYSWASNPLGFSSTLANPTVAPTASTTYTVTVTDAASATATGSVAVVVNQLPTVSATAYPDTICKGGSTPIYGSGANTYTWSNGQGTGTVIKANPTITTTYTVTGTDLNKCSNTTTIIITVTPAPATPVITQKKDSLISDAPAGNQWYMASGSIQKATNAFYIPQATDDYYVIATDNNKCSSNKSNVIHFNYELFSIDTLYAPITQPVKDSISLALIDSCLFDYTHPMDTFYIASAQVSNGKMQFNWVFKQGVKTYNLSSSIDVSKLQNGYNLIYLTIQCNITKKKGMLLKNTFAAPYTITTVSIAEVKQSAINVTLYPNPASDKFTIQIDNLKEAYTLEILNTTGQVVLSKQLTNSIEQVDLSGQAAGVYFVKLQSVNNSIVRKIIKQN